MIWLHGARVGRSGLRLTVAGCALVAAFAAWQVAGSALGAQTASQRPAVPAFAETEGWARLVHAHHAQRWDASAAAVAELTPMQLRRILEDLGHIAQLMQDAAGGRSDTWMFRRRLRLMELKPLLGLPSDLVMSVRPAAYADPESAVRQAIAQVMTRAALLNTDVAIGWAARGPAVPISRIPTGRSRPAVFQIRDGRRVESIDLNIHWEIARAAFDLVGPPEAASPFAKQWYLATSTRLVGERDYAIARHHLDHARRVLPDEARLWMLSGMVDENMAAPPVQTAIAEADPRELMNVDSVKALFSRAEIRYRKALELDPGLQAATVRLAHVLLRTGRPAEASDLLRQSPDEGEIVMQYFAALVLGQAERALGRPDDARVAFERARGLFPDAQSPRLALAELVWFQGRPEEAAGALTGWLAAASATAARFDPWWHYDVAPAADASQRVTEMYQAAERQR